MRDDEPLFYKYDFAAAVRNAPEQLGKTIDQLPDGELMSEDADALIDRLVANHLIAVPELDLAGVTVDEAEVNVDVSHDRMRMFHDRGPHYVKMAQYSFFVPYKGDRDVFFCQPSAFDFNPPRAGVRDSEVVVRIIKRDANADAAAIRKEFDAVVDRINSYLAKLRNDVQPLEGQLRRVAETRINQRRGKRQQDAKVVEGLGFPKRTQPS